MSRHARADGAELHDTDAEKIVLGAMLMSAPAVSEVTGILTAGDYYMPAHQVIHAAVTDLASQGDPHDPVAVWAEIERRGEAGTFRDKGQLYLIELISAVPAAANAGYYAQIVAVKASLRHVHEVGTRLIQASLSDDPDLTAILDLARTQIDTIGIPARKAGLEALLIELDAAAEIIEPPKLICGDMLYLGSVHTLTGPPDSGKTTLACWWMLQAVRDDRNVLFLDEEGGREVTAGKFQVLGARPGERIAYIPFPARSWGPSDILMLGRLLEARKPSLILWDSSAAFLSRAGLDENSATDVTRFYSHVLVPAARQHGAAVVAIDHDVKSGEMSRYARGSGAKLAATDVAYKITPITAFSKTQDGTSKLLITKDRLGWLHRSHEITFGTTATPGIRLSIHETAASEEIISGLTAAEQEVYSVLNTTPVREHHIIELIVQKHGHGRNQSTVNRALATLLKLGLADQLTEPSGHKLWTHTQ